MVAVGRVHPGADRDRQAPGGKDYGADHVLSTPSRLERQQLNAAIDTAADAVEMILAQGLATAQNEFNTRQPPDDPVHRVRGRRLVRTMTTRGVR